ncbi:hypothetical protein ACFL0X_02505 [Nanoarchaeota archaeon]
MLNQKQINEIREHLNRAQNPVFFFDNDQDGLCSFLLLRRYSGKGKGIPVRSFPDLTGDYFRRVEELNADYIFILDKPVVSEEFFKKVEQVNIPVVWIDHHVLDNPVPEFVNYYNPMNDFSKSEPTTFFCYQVSQKKEDLWIAIVGCVADKFVPDYYSEFQKKYPDLAVVSKDAFDIFYKSEIGKVARIFGFGLKDRTTNVISMLKFLMNVKSPYEVLDETQKNFTMHQRFKQIDKKYQRLVEKAKENVGEKVLFFQYGGDLSISSDLSNELSYLFPKKIVVVIYIAGVKANISVRGKGVREKVLKAIEGLEDATGGGHKDAVGAQVRVEDLEKFKEGFG